MMIDNDTNTSRIQNNPKGCKLKIWCKSLGQLIRVILDMPLNLPPVFVSLDADKSKVEISKLMEERNNKYQMLTDIGNAYTTLCIISILILVLLIVLGYIFGNVDKDDNWYVIVLALSVLPLAISPIYWYKKYCLKEYVCDLDDYIHLIELHECPYIYKDYKSAIISEFFLRRHSKKPQITIDLTPNKKSRI